MFKKKKQRAYDFHVGKGEWVEQENAELGAPSSLVVLNFT